MEEINLKRNNKWLVGILVIVIIILALTIGYFIWNDTRVVDKNISKNNGVVEQPKQTEMTAQWFTNYLTPVFKTNGRFDMVNATNEEIFSKGINLTVYFKGIESSKFEKVGEDFLIKQTDVADNIKKYYGIAEFVYKVNDNQFRYDQAKKGYLSTLEFGVGTSEGPTAQYNVSNIVYNKTDVTLTMELNYNGEMTNSKYSVNLNCINDQCVIKSITEN